MKETSTNIQARVAAELEAFPPQAASEFEAAWDAMSGELDGSQVGAWVEIGLKLAGQAARSWEAAAQYFRASPIVVGLMPFNYFVKWSECGLALCSESPTLATCYFSASPGAMARLRSRHIESWSNMGLGLYKGTWKSGNPGMQVLRVQPCTTELSVGPGAGAVRRLPRPRGEPLLRPVHRVSFAVPEGFPSSGRRQGRIHLPGV